MASIQDLRPEVRASKANLGDHGTASALQASIDAAKNFNDLRASLY